MTLRGVGVSPGRVCAPAFVHMPATDTSGEGRHDDGHADVKERRAALATALEASQAALEELIARTTERLDADAAAIFRAHQLMLDDPELADAIDRHLLDGALLPVAIERASEEMAALLHALPDEYLRERAADVLDVARRLLVRLGYVESLQLPGPGHPPVVLVAHDLAPSDTLALTPEVITGVVTEVGTRTSHAAILARQLGIPAVVGVEGLLAAVTDGHPIAIDGTAGECDPRPSAAKADQYAAATITVEVRRGRARTSDGVDVAVHANTSTPQEVASAVKFGADGVGLYRTEFLFHAGCALDDEEEQAEAYSAAVAAAADRRPMTFRTMDIGGDKPLAALPMDHEVNPFLGVRGVRLSLRRPKLFETQLRALVRVASAGGGIRVMVPMVSGLDELEGVKQILAGIPDADHVALGTMIEVPSAAVMIDEVLQEVDFVSVGTNDLTQYMLATDRTNARLEHLYDEVHPGVLRVLDAIVAAGQRQGKPVGLCGEVAADLRAVPLLVGMGFRSLSVAPPLVPHVKRHLSELSLAPAEELAAAVRAARTTAAVNALLSTFAEQEMS